MACTPVLIQKAHGTGSATFTNPTRAGSTVVVAQAIGDVVTSMNSVTDNKGNLYNNIAGIYGFASASQTDIWYINSPSPPLGGVTTVTTQTGILTWIYEIDCTFLTGSPNFADPIDVYGNITNGASASSLVGQTLGNVGSGSAGSLPGTVGDFCLAMCAVDAHAVTAVSAGWTLDTIQSGFAPAYNFTTNGLNVIPTFTASAATTFCISQAYFASAASSIDCGSASIVVHKATSPGGSSQGFQFLTSYGAPFTLTDGQSNNSGPLASGTYWVTEVPVANWTTTTDIDPTAIVVTSGNVTNVTFTNTQTTTPGGGGGHTAPVIPGGLGNGKNIVYDYNLNQQCWSLPGILQLPSSALGSIEVSPGVWRMLVSMNLNGTNVLAFRDITSFLDLGNAYTPNAVFGSIQVSDPGTLAKFGGRGGITLELTEAGTLPSLSVLPNDEGCTLGNAPGSQITGVFTSLAGPVDDPPTLGAIPKNYRSKRLYWSAGKALSAFVRHFQFRVIAAAENQPTELLGFGIFGDMKQEQETAGAIPQIQGR